MTGRTDKTWKGSARYFYSKKYFTKSMYLFTTDIFSVHSFSKNLVKSFKNAYICKTFFEKLLYSTAVMVKKRFVGTNIVY
jgi:hypothetical protein